MNINIKFLKKEEIPYNCFNRITGVKHNFLWYQRNHIFALKGVCGVSITINYENNR